VNTYHESNNWRPSAGLDALRQRADLLRHIREYFHRAAVMEVVTPAMSAAATTDPNIESYTVRAPATLGALSPEPLYLHTSPEFSMKRLLAAGCGDIYQICPVFRVAESGSMHNPEFQMLEWYRLGLDQHSLMDDLQALFVYCLQESAHAANATETATDAGMLAPDVEFERFSYYRLLEQVCGLSRSSLSCSSIAAVLADRQIDCPLSAADDIDVWLDLLMSTVVATQLPENRFSFVYDYPASQCSLARLRETSDGPVAERFELFYGSLELANGFYELQDADEQQRRFEQDLELRRASNAATVPIDQHLIDALHHGLPDCAGVAVGIDRLLMILTGLQSIDDVQCFPLGRA